MPTALVVAVSLALASGGTPESPARPTARWTVSGTVVGLASGAVTAVAGCGVAMAAPFVLASAADPQGADRLGAGESAGLFAAQLALPVIVLGSIGGAVLGGAIGYGLGASDDPYEPRAQLE